MQPPPIAPPFFGMSGPPGADPTQATTPPAVIWFKVYAGCMAALNLLFALVGLLILLLPSFGAGFGSSAEPLVYGMIYCVMGTCFAIPFAVACFLKPKPWVWVYDLVLIAFGFLSCCTWPASIPLFIYWIHTDTKSHFGTR